MNIARSTSALLGAFTLSAALAHGQAILSFSDMKMFKMVGPEESEYQGGSLNLSLNDGSVSFLPCAAVDPNTGAIFASGFFATFIGPIVGCPSGTTGLLSYPAFDFDGDGVRDTGLYASVSRPIPAIHVEPFRPSLISLASSSSWALRGQLDSFTWNDTSRVIFYDQVNDPRNGIAYELSGYNTSRTYSALELEKHRDEIVPGSYLFTFPRLGSSPANPSDFPFNHGHRPMVEAFPGPGGSSVVSGGINVGNDFRTTNDDRWRDGAMEFDPRIVSDFSWEGFNGITFLASDSLLFAVRDRETDAIVFPPFPPGQQAFPQLISGNGLPISSGYELGPTFFGPGDSIYVQLIFRRNLSIGNTVDSSVRYFTWDVDLIDSYEGFVGDVNGANFPNNATDAEIAPDFDYDDDGFTNLEEFALQTDPTDPASVPNPTPTINEINGLCELIVTKRPSVGSRLIYNIEFSPDLENWTVIDRDHPNFFLAADNENEIRVIEKSTSSIEGFPCFLRVRVTLP